MCSSDLFPSHDRAADLWDYRVGGAESVRMLQGDNPKRGELTDKLDIVKHIIDVKQSEAAAAEKRVARQQERQKLVELLERKNNEELEGLSKEEIEKKLAALDGE